MSATSYTRHHHVHDVCAKRENSSLALSADLFDLERPRAARRRLRVLVSAQKLIANFTA
jgi:hypothetical protein